MVDGARGSAGAAASRRPPSSSKFIVLLRCLARTTAEACGVDRCSIFVSTEGRLVPVMSQYASGKTREDLWPVFMALGPYGIDEIPVFVKAIQERSPVVLRDTPKAAGLPGEWQKLEVSAGLVVPLFGDAGVVGVMVLDSGATTITHEQIRRARVLARSVASAIDHRVSATAMQSRLRAAETLLSVGRTIGSTLELREVVRRITREAVRAVDADSAGIYLMTKDNRLEPFAGYHMPKEILDLIRSQPIPVPNVQDLHTQWSDEVPSDPAFQHPIFRRFPAQSLILAPLRAQDEIVGMLACAWWNKRRRLAPDERHLVEGIARQAATAIVNARLYAEAAQAGVDAERIRVDNVLHDTFRQTLFSVGLRIERCFLGRQRLSTLRSIVRDIKRDVSVMMTQINDVIPLETSSPALERLPSRSATSEPDL